MRLQRLQNKAARLVFACGQDECSVDLLTFLHWLPVKERILFKFILYVFKCMNHAVPSYLVALVTLLSDKYTARRQRLRSSSDTTRLFVPRSRERAGDSSFLLVATKLWNELSVYSRESESVPAFPCALKTHLFLSDCRPCLFARFLCLKRCVLCIAVYKCFVIIIMIINDNSPFWKISAYHDAFSFFFSFCISKTPAKFWHSEHL